MKNLRKVVILLSLLSLLTRCATRSVDDESYEDESSSEVSEDVGATEDVGASEDTESDPLAETESTETESAETDATDSENDLGEELALEEEAQEEQPPKEIQVEAEKPTEVAIEENSEPPLQEQVQPVIEEEPAPIVVQETQPEPVSETASEPVVSNVNLENKVTGVKLIPNETGGAIVIETQSPTTFTTRLNSTTNQFIVELQNVILPEKYKRPIISKDIIGTFGAIDAYQSPGSAQARFVIQLKSGVGQPAVQNEGNSLIVAATGVIAEQASVETPSTSMDSSVGISTNSGSGSVASVGGSAPLSSSNLNEFLANNNRFYGKAISIETENMNVRDALHFITEESGLNMIIAEEVSGSISLKLREVPWDQALVLLMKTKKLGYSRQGNVLRIAPLSDLKQEEDEATRLAQAKQTVEPLLVKMFQVSYAKMDDMQKNVKEFLSPRGKVISDLRTNSLVVTDIQDHLDRVAKLIEKLDTVPLQVLIEGKIVEATERFSRDLGVNWSSSGQLIKAGSGINMQPSFKIDPEAKKSGAFLGSLNVGVLDLLGTITSTLAISEKENKVKVISSPRILTLTNEKAKIEQVSQEPSRSVSNAGGIQTVSYSFVD
ncbi:MAG TPA: secretin N-terminal domain-containing protein, partial [Pseudobdellovibrionaceae bacterium]|nr:secretin N-terminal domain-containing protein [Pseudobdellovibrionaceae bacterium]